MLVVVSYIFYDSILLVVFATQRAIYCHLVWCYFTTVWLIGIFNGMGRIVFWDMVGFLFSLIVSGELLVSVFQVTCGCVEQCTRAIVSIDTIDVIGVLVSNGSNER